MGLPDDTVSALAALTGALADGEERVGQADMAQAVAEAIEAKRHLVVQAGTGTGKSLAYLVPTILSGKRTVVATATKALQDQLFGKDLPFVRAHLDRPFTYALLKGRSNYLCRQRVHEVDGDEQLAFDELTERARTDQLEQIMEWADDTVTGDRADLSFEPSPGTWAAVSVSALECPGATRCPSGDSCFAESARHAAAAADLVVVNTHLYGLHLAAGGGILPEHEVVVLDEAHQLEDTISDTSGVSLGAGRFSSLARNVRAIVEDPGLLESLDAAGDRLTEVLAADTGTRIRRMGDQLADVLALARIRIDDAVSALRSVPDSGPGDVPARRERALQAATHLADDLDHVIELDGPEVVWVDGPADRPTLRVSPLDVGEVLGESLWDEVTAVLTSATIPPRSATRLGLADRPHDQLDVGSPFDYEHHALLYCAAHLPEPRSPQHADAMHVELRELIEAAGGRTLALFTSWRAMDAAADALRGALPGPLLTQRDLPKPRLVEAFSDDDSASLFATMGFWQGIDVPGPSLSLVTIDRLPFPRPDDPVLEARRELARGDAFGTVDLPRAATLLAQGAGRLVRRATDQGVVAVLDSRLATAGYRWELVRALPPMRRTRDPADARGFLRGLRGAG